MATLKAGTTVGGKTVLTSDNEIPIITQIPLTAYSALFGTVEGADSTNPTLGCVRVQCGKMVKYTGMFKHTINYSISANTPMQISLEVTAPSADFIAKSGKYIYADSVTVGTQTTGTIVLSRGGYINPATDPTKLTISASPTTAISAGVVYIGFSITYPID